MKKLILILGIVLMGVAVYGQRTPSTGIITIPAGATDTTVLTMGASGDPWSLEFNASNLDGVDTVGIYGTAYSDSLTYTLIWVDQDLDGVNDNPWTLSATTNLVIWGESWPFIKMVSILTKGTSTAAKELHYYTTKK